MYWCPVNNIPHNIAAREFMNAPPHVPILTSPLSTLSSCSVGSSSSDVDGSSSMIGSSSSSPACRSDSRGTGEPDEVERLELQNVHNYTTYHYSYLSCDLHISYMGYTVQPRLHVAQLSEPLNYPNTLVRTTQ